MDVNLGGIFNMTKAVIKPILKARKGRIVNIGPIVGSTGNPGQVKYTSAKAGLIGFTKSLTKELLLSMSPAMPLHRGLFSPR